MDLSTRCCFTGHRPERLPWGTDEEDPRCRAAKQAIREALHRAYDQGFRDFVSGMARGGDLYFAEAVLDLREQHPEVTLECARPCETQTDRWPAPERRRYMEILDRCNYETLVQHCYDRGCMMRRNRYMVDRSSGVIALYDGVPRGGTFQTLTYAMRKDRRIQILDVPEK